MSEKRFFTKINKQGKNVIIDKECHTEIFDLTLACEVLNRLDLKRKWLNDENEQLRQKIGSYEKLITNSYEGEEENLDGEFVGKYVIWEDELERWREKYG